MRKSISKEKENNIYLLRDQGLTTYEIAEKLGLGQSTVARYVRKYKDELVEAEKILEATLPKTKIITDKQNIPEEKVEVSKKWVDDCEYVIKKQKSQIQELKNKIEDIKEELKSKLDNILPKKFFDEKEEKFYNIAKENFDLYQAKNKDYGNAFSVSYDEFGAAMSAIRLQDKLMRFKRLIQADNEVKSESIIDTLRDLSNYAIMTIIEMDK